MSRAAATRILLSALLFSVSCGCVSRRLTIRSDPPGALVEVDGERIATTPASLDFTYYGNRRITLSKPGYETLTVEQPVPPPWYQIFPIEFIADNLLPFRVTNRHDFIYQLPPRQPRLDEEDQLFGRGQGFRSQALIGP